MTKDRSITKWFGDNLAKLLADKIKIEYNDFDEKKYIKTIKQECKNLSYSKRIELHANVLKQLLPKPYSESIKILMKILGDENPNETGMFTEYWWIMPIGKYVELYGLDNYEKSIYAIEEITKRNTGEYAIRPFIRKYPDKCLKQMEKWAKSDNFHLRRLASEGLRPKLPWSAKLNTFNDNPEPVFQILELLKEDKIMFVKKSVGNHLTDWLKVNYEPTKKLLQEWQKSNNKHTQWIVKRATRKISIE